MMAGFKYPQISFPTSGKDNSKRLGNYPSIAAGQKLRDRAEDTDAREKKPRQQCTR